VADDTNAEDLFPIDQLPDPALGLADTELKPEAWHKPRKQWIRKEQWGRLVNDLLTELNLQSMPFRYLTLPGKHLFDVRHLHDVCAARKTWLQYLGFDISRKGDARISVSEHEVRSLPYIHGDSLLLADRLENLAGPEPGSVALSHARKLKSFDAVNLDLCNSVASPRTNANNSSLAAIGKLIQLQADGRTDPWLLFVTTRASRESVDSEVMQKLLAVLQANLQQHDRFRTSVADGQLFEARHIEDECNGQPSLLAPEFIHAFGIGFCKWLLQLARSNWAVKQEISACYRVSTDTPDMLSLAFRCERCSVPVVDPNKVVTLQPLRRASTIPSEIDLELGFLERFNDLVDVDQLLHRDEALREQMIVENANLMSLARFSRDQMINWGRSVCWKPPEQAFAQGQSEETAHA